MWFFENRAGINYKYDYSDIAKWLNKNMEGDEAGAIKYLNYMGKDDLFFLMYFMLDIRKINHEWLVPKIYEVQREHNRTLDLWSRETFKSTSITYALPIQELFINPEERIGIFSYTRNSAKDFANRIAYTLENNLLLKRVYPEILYDNPARQSQKWSENEGYCVKRKGFYNEMSLEAYGLSENMPTGKHYTIRAIDDLVSPDSVRSAELIKKTREGFQMSHNLGVTEGGTVRLVGTRYDYNDLYSEIIKSGDWKVREYAADKDPAFWSEEILAQKKKDMGPYVFSTQISLVPLSEDNQKFLVSWIKWIDIIPKNLNKYILVDPAGEKKEKSAYTVMWVIGVDWKKNKFVLDIVRDKLNNEEKWDILRDLVIKHEPLNVGYEKYSMQSDIQYLEKRQADDNVFFEITPLGGSLSKKDRIRGLIPYFARGEMFFPKDYSYTDVEGKKRNLVKEFLEDEYIHFPNISYYDMLDSLARIDDRDLKVVYPQKPAGEEERKTNNTWFLTRVGHKSWMGKR